jgi:hypothetical protein
MQCWEDRRSDGLECVTGYHGTILTRHVHFVYFLRYCACTDLRACLIATYCIKVYSDVRYVCVNTVVR